MMKTHSMTDMGDESSEMGIGRFGRMETDEEEEDNATEMCNKQSEMGNWEIWKNGNR
jgi:hypothetical protein